VTFDIDEDRAVRSCSPAAPAAPQEGETVTDDLGALTTDLDYPMLVVTAVHGEALEGCLVGFASQCSISPLRFMVWISKVNRTAEAAARAAVVAVHYLSTADRAVAELFGEQTGDDIDKFERCRWHTGPSGAAILDDCSRWLVGRVLQRFDTGDHTGLLLEPIATRVDPWEGQLGYQSVRDLEPGHPA
jgi:flavin reductase (DIM6/NTAB) family NADH-FMN oxidoreductase RutF